MRENYKRKYKELPSYKSAYAIAKEITKGMLNRAELRTFLEEFGIKSKKKRVIIRYYPKNEKKALKIVKDLLNKGHFVMIPIENERHVIKVCK